MTPDHINSVQWNQSLGYARQVCARMFRDGGTPVDAVQAFGLMLPDHGCEDWSKAVDAIAQSLCTQQTREAA